MKFEVKSEILVAILTANYCILAQITKRDVDTFMSMDPPLVPNCVFIADWVSRAGRPPAQSMRLEIKMNGSQPPGVNFLVDFNSQGSAYLFLF